MTPTPHQNQDTITLDHGAPIARHPNGRMMLRHPAHLLAFGFGVGLSPRAPGTLAT
ncbi:MAG: phosphatidylglycerophosphatase A, partial [Ottowia sp.]|nr:phosphatidylglycerophosphatase A [Ottowia sp.]